MRLPQYTEHPAGRVLSDETANLVLGYAAGFRDTRNLEQGGGGRNVGIKPARRGGDEIDRNLGRRIRRRQLVGIAFYPLDKRF